MRLQVLDKEDRTLTDRIKCLSDAIDQKLHAIEVVNSKLDAVLREIDHTKHALQSLDYQLAELQRATAGALGL